MQTASGLNQGTYVGPPATICSRYTTDNEAQNELSLHMNQSNPNALPSLAQSSKSSIADSDCPMGTSCHVIKEWTDDSQHTRYVDFMLDSPYEIVAHILSYLPIGSICECTRVSQRWYSRLVKLHKPWETMTISEEESTSDYLLLRDVSHYVRSLRLYDMTPRLIRYIELVEPHSFPNLRSLALVTFLHSVGVIDLRTYLYETLACTAHSLEQLHIQELSTRMVFSLDKILRIYSNLTTLQLDVWNIVDYSISYATRLTSIDLKMSILDMHYDIHSIQSFFQHSPQLRYLKLQYYTTQGYDILLTLEDHCPSLTTLIINQESFERTYTLDVPEQIDEQPGCLQCLVLNPLVLPHLLVPRLKRSLNTLRTMCLDPAESIPSSSWDLFSTVTLSKLTFLQINLFYVSTEFVHQHLPRILRCYPSLETFILEQFMIHVEGAGTNELFDTLTQLPRLSRLRLASSDIRGEGLLQFLRHHANDGSSLQEVSIFSCSGLSKMVLQHIARLPKLKELAFKDVDYDVEQSDFKEFMKLASKNMTQLSSLKMEFKRFDDQVAEITREFKNLSSVTFT
ncbi:hypothetical protein BJV82DRAFT_623548 [Fennellomyces sp. T-0311]|nr:hypothetical protein BJV82DRAFT_623548 [Fennellomyces sp. T-0311]